MRNISEETCRENQNTLFMAKNSFLKTIVPILDKVEKYCRGRQARDDNMVRAHCIQDT